MKLQNNLRKIKYNPKKVFSSIDKNGRYSFGNQPNIIHWNLAVFANTLIPLISDNKEKSVELIKDNKDDSDAKNIKNIIIRAAARSVSQFIFLFT